MEELYRYSQKLIPAIETVSKELAGERQDDTDEYLKSVLNGINWIIEVLNRTMELVNEEEIVIDKDKINEDILKLGETIKEKDDEKMAEVLKEKVLPFIVNASTRAAVVTNQTFN